MAEIRPFRAWRYNRALLENIGELTSPLFDVTAENEREELYRNPLNSIHISAPRGDRPAQKAASALKRWRQKKYIVKDDRPGIYVYYQHYTLPPDPQEYCRKGFICKIRVYDWEKNVILRHENIMPKLVNAQHDLIAETRLNATPTHGLYTDALFSLEPVMDEFIRHPICEAVDVQGISNVLGVINDESIIARFVETLKDKQVILADGHHRYAGSLAYMQQNIINNPAHTGKEGYNYHLIWLTNTEADDLRIHPTHRLINELGNFDEAATVKRFKKYFRIKPVADASEIKDAIIDRKWNFGILFKENAYIVQLRPEAFSTMKWDFPDEIKELDLTVAHYFIIQEILKIPGKMQNRSPCIEYERDFTDCVNKVISGKAQMAIITNYVSIEDVKRVSACGCMMPKKSTFFYPKVICGFLYCSL